MWGVYRMTTTGNPSFRAHSASTPWQRAYSMIRSRMLSAGTGRIPARIFSSVNSMVFPPGTRGTSDDRDDRLNASLPQLEGENDPVGLEQQARFVHFGREPVGEVRDQIFGKPGVDLLVGEDGLPVRLVADIVAKLKALRDELLGAARALFARKADHGTIIVGLVSQREPGANRDRGEHTEADANTDQPLRRLVHWTSRSVSERDARAVNDQRSGASSQVVNRGIRRREVADPYMKDTTNSSNGQPGLPGHDRAQSGFSAHPALLDQIGPAPGAKSQRKRRMSMRCMRRLTFYGEDDRIRSERSIRTIVQNRSAHIAYSERSSTDKGGVRHAIAVRFAGRS